jgi:hypothetical protein
MNKLCRECQVHLIEDVDEGLCHYCLSLDDDEDQEIDPVEMTEAIGVRYFNKRLAYGFKMGDDGGGD